MKDGAKVLLAHGDPEQYQRVVGTLRDAGYEAIPAPLNDGAIELARRERPDLILLGGAPGEIRSLGPVLKRDAVLADTLAVVLCEQEAVHGEHADMFDTWADGYIPGASSPRALVSCVSAYLRIKETEDRLRESERRLSTLMGNLPGMAYRCRNTGAWTMEFLSGGCRSLTGYGVEELTNDAVKAYGDLIHPEDRTGVWTAVQEAVDGNARFEIEYRIIRADGAERWVWERGAVIPAPVGDDAMVEGFITDITERKHGEEELRQSEARLETVFAALPVGVMIVNARTHVLKDANPAALRHMGADRDRVVGHVCHQRVCLAEEGACPVTDLNQTVDVSECVLVRGDGSHVPILKTVRPIRLADEDCLIETFIDISEKKRAEADRQRLEDQLRQAQKMESVGQLAGGVAHDFNNILQAVLTRVSFLLDGMPAHDERYEDLIGIQQGAERAATLVRQLLAFGRKQVLDMRETDLNELVGDFMIMLRRAIPESIEIDFISGHGLGLVRVDPLQIKQVLMNLCLNARDVMPDGGTITIETQNVLINGEYCRTHQWAKPGRYVLLTTSDTGCGMDEKTRQRVFDPFFTTKGVGKGMGLGLATVYGVVAQHKGMVQVYSEIGKGTLFKIYLPLVERRAAEVEKTVDARPRGGAETILLAEDDEMVRDLGVRVLARAGYRVLVAKDGEEAIELFSRQGGDVDLALLDVVMPRKGGRHVHDYIRSVRPGTRVLFSSGYSENAIHTRFVLDEGMTLIQKPYEPAALLRAVRAALDS
ncbi:MAG TPA: PAS domain S-box protein [Candidatus Hydrogenedentes bacterium]|nr:PAS domain S-box protein [Candidatus Hydrogenedentota bacterium]